MSDPLAGAALCAEVDPELFFAEKGRGDLTRTAVSICAGCELRAACLDYALAHRMTVTSPGPLFFWPDANDTGATDPQGAAPAPPNGAAVNGRCTATVHDTDDAYDHGCRCPEARNRHRVERKRRQIRLVTRGPQRLDGTGTARRLQALATMSWSIDDIAARLGVTRFYVGNLRAHRRGVMRATADKVRAIYDEISDLTGPSPRAAEAARRAGWQPPLAWDETTIDDPQAQPWQWCQEQPPDCVDYMHTVLGSPPCQQFLTKMENAERAIYNQVTDIDPVVVERLIDGQRVPHTRAERLYVTAYLVDRGHTSHDIAGRLHIERRTVDRYRAEIAAERARNAQGADHTPHHHNDDREVAS